MNIADLEEAVQLSFHVVGSNRPYLEKEQLKRKIADFLQNFRNRPDAWQGYLELFSISKDPSVRFYALQQLKELLSSVASLHSTGLTATDCQVIRGKFVLWIQHNIGTYASEPTYIKNYIAVVYALLLKILYPEHWTAAFQDVLEIADKGHAGGIELFLRVLLYVDEEVVAVKDRLDSNGGEAEHNTLIKDAMRVSALEHIVDMWYSIFLVCRSSRPDLVRTCLEVASEYVGWIDISLSVNDRVTPMLYYFLAKRCFRIDATKVLYEIIAKGMPQRAKLELLRHLDILEILQQLCVAQQQEASPLHVRAAAFEAKIQGAQPRYGKSWSFEAYEETYSEEDQDQTFMEMLAEIANLVCVELLCCGSALKDDPACAHTVVEELSKSVQLLIFHFLSYQDIKVQGCTLEFVGKMVTEARTYKLNKGGSKGDAGHSGHALGKLYVSFIPKLLPVLMRGMCFPPSHTFELENEEDAVFEAHRKNLRKIFVNVARFAEFDVVIPFLQSIVREVFSGPDPVLNRPMSEVEVVLALLYAFPEGTNGVLELTNKNRRSLATRESPAAAAHKAHMKSSMADLIKVVLSAGLSRHPHPAVVLVYNDLIERYMSLLVECCPELIAPALRELAGNGGIKSKDSRVRSRACYLLLRILKTLQSNAAGFAQDLLVVIKDSLNVPYAVVLEDMMEQTGQAAVPQKIEHQQQEHLYALEDIMVLFEIAGILIGSKWAEPTFELSHLLAVVSSTHQQLQHIAEVGGDESYANWAGSCVAAIAAVSKGFGARFKPEVAQVFGEILQTALRCLERFTSEDQGSLFSKIIILLHRMVTGMKETFVPLAPRLCMSVLNKCTTPRGLLEVLQFLCQIVREFEASLFDCIDSLLLPVLQATSAQLASLPKPQVGTVTFNHEQNEYITLQRHSFTFLYDLVNSKLSSVLFSPKNIRHLEDVLKYLSDGLALTPHPISQKTCVSTLSMLTRVWLPKDFASNANLRGALGFEVDDQIEAPGDEYWAQLSKTIVITPDCNVEVPDNVRQVYARFLFQTATRCSFEAILSHRLPLNDAMTDQLITNVCLFHLTLTSRLGMDWLHFLSKVFLPSAQCPPQAGYEYIHAILTNNIKSKTLRTVFKQQFCSKTNG